MRVTLVCGGLGGARLAPWLAERTTLTVVVSVADDAQILGLRICPDLDSVLYALRPVDDVFVQMYIFNGGQGALGGQDGLSTCPMPDNVANVPVEVMEHRAPVLFRQKSLVTDSGGAGRFRGGLGQRVDLEFLQAAPVLFYTSSVDRIRNAPFGLEGGHPGGAGRLAVDGRPIDPRRTRPMGRGEVLTAVAPGGGGFGDPRERDPVAVREDVRLGLVSAEAARAVYGVAPLPEGPGPPGGAPGADETSLGCGDRPGAASPCA